MKLWNRLKMIFSKRARVEEETFRGIDLEHMFTSPKVAEDIRARVQEIIDKKKNLMPQYEKATNELTLVQRIDQLPKEEINDLEVLATLYSETLMEKDTFQKVIQNQSTVPKYLEKYKNEIPKVIKQLKEHEKRQNMIKNDLNILEGEKGEINFRSTRSQFALNFLRLALIITLIASAIVALILTTMFFVYNSNVFIPSIITVVLILFIILWIFVFRRYLIYDLKKNAKLQKRLTELNNKTKIKYVNVQQFLDYEHKKYQVNSSEMLELRWENYQQHAKNEARFKRVSNNVSTMLQDINRLLIRNNINADTYVTDHIDYFTSKKGRTMLQNALEIERQDIKKAIDQCENDILVLSRLLEEIMDHT